MATSTPYKIQSGDTLSQIAVKNGTTVDALAKANNIADPNKIFAGQTLNISKPEPIVSSSNVAVQNPNVPATPPVISASSLGQPVNAPIIKPVNDTTASNNLGVAANMAVNTVAPNVSPNTVHVVSYVDNPDGTTTNTLSDGTKSVVRYVKNADGTLQPVEQTKGSSVTDVSQVNDTKSLAEYMKGLVGTQSTKGDFTTQANNDVGVADKTQALNDLNNKALLTKKSYEDQIQKLKDTNPDGAFGGGLDIQINDLTRKANQDLANIGILQQVAQNNLAAAQKIVETKVAAKFEPIDNEIKSLSTLYNLYSNDMTESEKLKAQSAIDEKKSKKSALQTAYQNALNTASDNGAPQNIFTAIDTAVNNPNATPADLYKALGQYGQSAAQKRAASEAQFGALTKSDETTGMNWLLTNGGTKEDQSKFKTDRAFQAWVMSQAG